MLASATQLDLARVAAACDEFRAHWASLRSMPFDATFEGGISDIRALDYLDYESLAYPAGGLESAALVWGNILVRRAGFNWVRSVPGELLLQIEEPGYRLVVWPFSRVFEMQCRSFPQDGKYCWLTACVLKECLQDPYGSVDVEKQLRCLLQEVAGSDGT